MAGLALLRVGPDGRVAATGGNAELLFGIALGRACHRVVGAFDVAGQPICSADCARELLAGARETSARSSRVGGLVCRVECRRVGHDVIVVVEPQHATGNGPTCELSARERQTLALVAEGLSAREIGQRLGLSASTVRTHLERARRRLRARSSAEAVAKWAPKPG